MKKFTVLLPLFFSVSAFAVTCSDGPQPYASTLRHQASYVLLDNGMIGSCTSSIRYEMSENGKARTYILQLAEIDAKNDRKCSYGSVLNSNIKVVCDF